MKFVKAFLKILLTLIVLAVLGLYVTGHAYIFKGVRLTYLRGEKSATIDDHSFFATREVKAGTHQPWAIGKNYNQQELSDRLKEELEQTRSVAFLVVQDDSIRSEQYWEGYNEDARSNSFSMAKSIISILTGIAIKEGKIKSLDQPVGDFLEPFKEGKNASLTIRHLLTMSSGLSWVEHYTSPFSITAKAYYGSNLRKLMLRLEVIEEPGKEFRYLSGNTQLMGMVLEQAVGTSVSDYASEKLWKPIGAKHTARWTLDREEGMEKTYCCFNSNARDFARIGKLYLNRGNWEGQQIVPENYALLSVRPAKAPYYGYSWWITGQHESPVFYARGILGQYIIVVPERKLIAVRAWAYTKNKNPIAHTMMIFICM